MKSAKSIIKGTVTRDWAGLKLVSKESFLRKDIAGAHF